MRVYAADKLALPSRLGSVRVIDDQAYGLVVIALCLTVDFLDQLSVH